LIPWEVCIKVDKAGKRHLSQPKDLSSITDDNFISTANPDSSNIISYTASSITASSNPDDDSDASTNTSSKSDSSSPSMVWGQPKDTAIANSLDYKARIEAAMEDVERIWNTATIAKQKAT
jgi:hypothetical protein